MDYVELVIKYIVDSFEEFFDAISAPTSKHIRNSFLFSLGFLLISIVCNILSLWSFVSWQEALTCSIILGLITLIDGSVRSSVGSSVNKIKSLASNVKFKQHGDAEELEGSNEN